MLKQKISAVIIEKDLTSVNSLKKLLKKADDMLVAGSAVSGKHGLSLIVNLEPRLIFVNIKLNDIDGFEFIQKMHKKNIFPEIIFLADNEEEAFQALQFEPLDFWTKPFNRGLLFSMKKRLNNKLKKQELLRKMDVFAEAHQTRQKRIFKQKNGIVILYNDEIIFCRAQLASTNITLITGEEIQVNTGISETTDTLNSSNFIRVNRSYCINRKYLHKIEKRTSKCILHDGKTTWDIPVSKKTLKKMEKMNVFPIY
jgi:DNA-binding LytR/AlgR family response regulator